MQIWCSTASKDPPASQLLSEGGVCEDRALGRPKWAAKTERNARLDELSGLLHRLCQDEAQLQSMQVLHHTISPPSRHSAVANDTSDCARVTSSNALPLNIHSLWSPLQPSDALLHLQAELSEWQKRDVLSKRTLPGLMQLLQSPEGPAAAQPKVEAKSGHLSVRLSHTWLLLTAMSESAHLSTGHVVMVALHCWELVLSLPFCGACLA